MADAERAARPAGDEPEAWWSPSNGYIVPTEPSWPDDAPKRVRVRDRRVLREMPIDAVHLTAAHVGQRDGGAAGDNTGMDGVTDDTSAWLMVATGGRSRLAVQGDIGDIREALAEVLERRGAEQ